MHLPSPTAAAARALALSLLGSAALAQDWTNYGGNASRNGRSSAAGPTAGSLAWSNTADFSIIAWHPFVLDGRVFSVRESGFPQNGGAANDAIVAYDLATGTELWRTTLPFNGNTNEQWIAWIAGARDGRVYVSRSSHSKPQPMMALDAATGNLLWTSALSTDAWAHDGVVFAPDGDLVVGDFTRIVRMEAGDGSTVWNMPRSCPVSGNCGAAATDTALYIDEPVPGGNQITKLDIATGQTLYSSPVMAGFTNQNSPFLGPDGSTVYFSRTQNNTSVDFLFAFEDDSSAFVQKWMRPVRWTTSHEHGIGRDGSIYTFLQTDEFVRLDPATGGVLDSAGVLAPLGSPNLSPKSAVDRNGNVYVSNGWASSPATDGRMWAFGPDLSQNLFTLVLDRQNAGGPVLAGDGYLVVCDRQGVFAYRDPGGPRPYCTTQENSQGCEPLIGWQGTPSASAGSGFDVFATDALNNKSGILFYGLSGRAALPFQGGTLCVRPPLRRTPVRDSGGNPPPSDCSGVFSMDFNQRIASGVDPALVQGAAVNAQWWSRDPQDPAGTNLTDALEFTIAP